MLLYFVVLVTCVTLALTSGPCAPSEDLLNMLTLVHHTASYTHLSAANKVLASELISAAHTCQLTQYIYSHGLYKVLGLLDELTPTEAHALNKYMKNHLELEHTLASLHPPSTHKP